MKKFANFASVIVAMVCVLSILACSGGGGPKPTPPCTENCGPVVNDGSTMEKAVPVVIGTVQTRVKKEEAYYSVTLMPGESYKFLIGAPAVTTLFDPDGNSLATSSDYEDGIIIWNCSSGGKYYFLVEPDNINRDYQILVIIADDPVIDSDDDGVVDSEDSCPGTPANESADANGCSNSQIDSDDDGVVDSLDICPATPAGESADVNGCADSQKDSDGDGIVDSDDEYPNCDDRIDSDGDGISDCEDQCPTNPSKVEPGTCGCDVSDVDTDGDGLSDCIDIVNNNGLTMETAKKIVNGMNNVLGEVVWYYFDASAGNYYWIETSVTNNIEHEMSLLDKDGNFLSFNPRKSKFTNEYGARIYNWQCPLSGRYYIKIESDYEFDYYDAVYKIILKESNALDYSCDADMTMVKMIDPDSLLKYDKYDSDRDIYHAKGIALNELQNRIQINSNWNGVNRYGEDYIFFHAEAGVSYRFLVDNIIGNDLIMYIYDRNANDLACFNPSESDSINDVFTSETTDWILLLVKNWIPSPGGASFNPYTIQVMKN